MVRGNYGHAGRKYIRYLQEADMEALGDECRAICKELQASNSTGKQIQNLAFILLADRIAGRCIFEGENPLQLSQVTDILRSEKEVSSAERAYQFIIGWIADNRKCFTEESVKIYGRIKPTSCLFSQNELIQVLNDNGYDFNEVKKEWDRLGYLRKNSQD